MMDDIPMSNGQLRAVLLVVGVVLAAVASPILLMPSDTAPADAEMGDVTTPQPTSTDSRTSADRMYSVPDSHVDTIRDLDSDAAPQAPADVAASAGSQTMRVDTTTVDGEPALVLSDDDTHDGRWVSVGTEWLEDVHGSVPQTVTIAHESGDTYTEPVRVRGDDATFYVREFSQNTVTFSGEVVVEGNPASDGTQYTYDVADLDSASNVSVDLTGVTNTDETQTSSSGVFGSKSTSFGVGGTDNATAQVTVIGVDDKSSSATGSGSSTLTNDNPTRVVTELTVTLEHTDDSIGQSRTLYYSVDGGSQVSLGSVTVGTGETVTKSFTVSLEPTDSVTMSYGSGSNPVDVTKVTTEQTPPTAVSVGFGGDSASLGDFGPAESKTVNLTATPNAEWVNVTANSGAWDQEIILTEQTGTTDTGVELNGCTVSETGTLPDGETVSKTMDESCINQGTNTVNVSVGDGTLSADAPTPQVRLNLSHDAADRQSVDYTAEQWSSRYNVSKTYSSARSNATLTIPFDDSSVMSMRAVEYRINESGGWTSMSSSNYAIDGTTLTANLSDASGGEIPAGTTVEVRANASKIDVVNGSITILEATGVNSDLDTKIEVDSASDNFRIETADGRIKYAANASYSPDTYWVADQQGQRIHLPNAAAGDTLRVRSIPVSAAPQSGDVHVTVANTSSTEPAFAVDPGQTDADEVAFTFETAADGTSYVLWSTTYEIVRDSGTASSPLTLSDDDSMETLKFLLDDGGGGGSSSSSSGGGGGIIATPQQSTDWLPLIGVALALAGLVVASRNSDAVSDAGSGAADGIEGALGGIPVVGPVAGTALGGVVRSGAQLVRAGVENRTIALALGGAVAWGAIQGGIIALPAGSTTIILVAGVAAISFVGLREVGEFRRDVWAGIVVATAATAAVVTSEADPVAAVTDSAVFPLVVIGALYLGFRGIQAARTAASTPDSTTEVVIETDGGDER